MPLGHLRHLDPQTRIVVGARLDLTDDEGLRLDRSRQAPPDPGIATLLGCPVTGKSARSGALTCAGLFKWQESDRCRAIEVGPPCAGVGSCQLFRPGGVGRVEPGCGEGDGVGVDRRVRVGVVAGRGAVAVVGGLQCEEPVSPVERNDCW